MAEDTDRRAQLERLRATAQAHLSEIEAEIAQEKAQEQQTQQDMEKYAKRNFGTTRRKSRSPRASVELEDEAPHKGPRFRTAREVLDRLRWDKTFDVSEYHVGYLERFDGVKEMPVSSWIKDFTDEEWIPQHRIRYFKRIAEGHQPEIVWDRIDRVDRIFSEREDNKGRDEAGADLVSLESASEAGGVNI